MWLKDNAISRGNGTYKEVIKNKNIKLSKYSKIIKYLIKLNRKPNEYHFNGLTVREKQFDIIKKKLWSNGIFKKIMGDEIIIIEGDENMKAIIERIPKVTRAKYSFASLSEYFRPRTTKKEIGIIGKSLNLENNYFNDLWITGVNKRRTDIYVKEHKMVSNTPCKSL
jgi:hypothetical protein